VRIASLSSLLHGYFTAQLIEIKDFLRIHKTSMNSVRNLRIRFHFSVVDRDALDNFAVNLDLIIVGEGVPDG
jgi:hypothetical protein